MHFSAAVLQMEDRLSLDYRSLLPGFPVQILEGVVMCLPLPSPPPPSHKVPSGPFGPRTFGDLFVVGHTAVGLMALILGGLFA